MCMVMRACRWCSRGSAGLDTEAGVCSFAGLNLNSADSLWSSFVSPLSDVPVKAKPHWTVPRCYKHTPPRWAAW